MLYLEVLDARICDEIYRLLKNCGATRLPVVRKEGKLLIPVERHHPVIEQVIIEYKNKVRLLELPFSPSKRPTNYKDLLRDKLSEEEFKLLPTSYDIIGEVVVIKIPPKLFPKARLIGEALLNFHRGKVRTVYAKISPIKGTFRTSTLECIAGEDIPLPCIENMAYSFL